MSKINVRNIGCTLAACLFVGSAGLAPAAEPLGSGFSFQGQLKQGGAPLNDTADFEFTLHDADVEGNQIGGLVAIDNVIVVDGLFTVEVNAGGEFGADALNGEARFLQVAVRSPASGGDFTPLDPRQPLTGAPYALKVPGVDGHSLDAADGDPVDALLVDNNGDVTIDSNLIVDTDALFVDGTSGEVGIGQANPSATLDVVGTTELNGDVTITGVLDVTANTARLGGDVRVRGFADGDVAFLQARDDGEGDIALQIRTQNAGAIVDALRIDQNGRVGIGTPLPTATLDVVGTTELNGDVTINSNLTVDTDALFVDGRSARVGIGTNTPTEALDVVGTVAADAFQGDGSGLSGLVGFAGSTVDLDNVALLRWDLLNQSFPVGNFPQGVAFDGANIWVTNEDDATVTRISLVK